jgi:hypothetical protein
MGSGRIKMIDPDLFSTAASREQHKPWPKPPTNTLKSAATSLRHVLPSDLPAAIRHLNDQELDELHAAVTAEQQRRGKKPVVSDNTPIKRSTEAAVVSLPSGKLNVVRAAFKAGVTPAKIARQFGISQSDVRKVLASDRPKP